MKTVQEQLAAEVARREAAEAEADRAVAEAKAQAAAEAAAGADAAAGAEAVAALAAAEADVTAARAETERMRAELLGLQDQAGSKQRMLEMELLAVREKLAGLADIEDSYKKVCDENRELYNQVQDLKVSQDTLSMNDSCDLGPSLGSMLFDYMRVAQFWMFLILSGMTTAVQQWLSVVDICYDYISVECNVVSRINIMSDSRTMSLLCPRVPSVCTAASGRTVRPATTARCALTSLTARLRPTTRREHARCTSLTRCAVRPSHPSCNIPGSLLGITVCLWLPLN